MCCCVVCTANARLVLVGTLYCLGISLLEKGLCATCKAAVEKGRRPCLDWQCQWPFAANSRVACENAGGSSVFIPLLTHAPAHYPLHLTARRSWCSGCLWCTSGMYPGLRPGSTCHCFMMTPTFYNLLALCLSFCLRLLGWSPIP